MKTNDSATDTTEASTPFDRRIEEIIDRNQGRSDNDSAKDDINWLLMWLASYKGRAEGYQRACDDVGRYYRGDRPTA